MLRWVIGLFVLFNAVFYAWAHGHMAGLGFAPDEQREPQRLQMQLNPELVRLFNVSELAGAIATGPLEPTPNNAPQTTEPSMAPTACWVTKGFTSEQVGPLEQRMLDLALPKGSWQIERVSASGRWVVYMGRFPDERLARKKDELRKLNVEFHTLISPPLGPGLSLGTYSSEAAAEQGLKDVQRKGVRSARVEQERSESVSHTLRLAEVTEMERIAVEGLDPDLLEGKTFQSCK